MNTMVKTTKLHKALAILLAAIILLLALPIAPMTAKAGEEPPARESFSFEVTVTTESGLDFAIPLSGISGKNNGNPNYEGYKNYGKAYNWLINWGDGNSPEEKSSGDSDAPQNAADSAGLKHTYAKAGTYKITITSNGATDDAWLAAFGFSNDSDSTTGANANANRAKLTKLLSPITPKMTRTAEQISGEDKTLIHFEWNSAFSSCVNLGKMDDNFTFAGWDDITTAGNNFAQFMFKQCTGVEFTMGENFNLPQSFTSVGKYFAASMFLECYALNDDDSLNADGAFTMNEVFNLPPDLKTAEEGFAARMFESCKNPVFNMNDKFNLPQSLTSVGSYFAHQMFYGCSGARFTMNDEFNLPQNLTSEGGAFASSMFSYCRGESFTMNDEFNLPQNLETVKSDFAYQMFSYCRGESFTMNDEFNLPQNLTSVGSSFASSMFSYCNGENFTMNSAFNLPQSITTVGSSFASMMFSGCSGESFTMNDEFNLPQSESLTTVGNNFAYQMFYNCKGAAFTMNSAFNLPQKITTMGNNFAYQMFSGCTGAGFMVNDKFVFPKASTSPITSTSKSYYQTFYNVTAKQTRLASSIIGTNEKPTLTYKPLQSQKVQTSQALRT